MFVFVARGFTNQDLRQGYAVLLGQQAGDITPGRMSYELRRLRLHGLIERVPKTHRYHLTDPGLQTALFYTRVYSRILRPGLALVSPRHLRPHQRHCNAASAPPNRPSTPGATKRKLLRRKT
jgi:hypothetical protein